MENSKIGQVSPESAIVPVSLCKNGHAVDDEYGFDETWSPAQST